MKLNKLLLITSVFIMNNLDATEGDPEYNNILAHLSDHIEILDADSIKGVVAVSEIWKESNQEKERQFHAAAKLAIRNHVDMKALTRSHELGWQAWRRRCLVLIDQLKLQGTELRRFEEGSGGAGYVILENGSPKYWLHVQTKATRSEP